MNTKTSFFNFTIFKKDLSRFWPLWAIYLIFGLLVTASNFGSCYYADARTLSSSLCAMSMVMCMYAILAAGLLFGDLFQSRMCNAIHALPVRREGLFLTHYAAGLAMGILPNVPIALVSMVTLGRLWFVAPLWLAGVSLMYLVFFGIAVFCVMCSGRAISGLLLYLLVNLLGVIVMWFFEVFYIPLLYGMEMTDASRNIFYIFTSIFNYSLLYPFMNIACSCIVCS